MRFTLYLLLFFCSKLVLQTSLVLTDPRTSIPIGVPFFCKNGAVEQELAEAIARNLQISAYFNVLPRDAYIQKQTRCNSPEMVVGSDWSIIGARYVVTGSGSEAGGMVTFNLFLVDVSGKVVLAKSYTASKSLYRRIAHKFSNEILRYFTGEPGPFGSKIIYSTKVGRFKELAIMDMDGYDQRIITSTKGLANSPSFDRSGRRAIYTDFRKAIPDVFIIDTVTQGITQVTSNRDQEFSPIFLNDSEYIVSLANPRGGSSIVVINKSGQILRTLVGSIGEINVSPVVDFVNNYLYYVSDIAGKPQVYRVPLSGGTPQRITREGYCTSPAISPKGDKLAFVCRVEGGFNLLVSNPDGSNPVQLTSYGRNEDPSWSPDGRYIAFSSTAARGTPSICIIRFDGRGFTSVSTPFGQGDFAPDWGPIPED